MQEQRSHFGIAWADDGRLFAIGGQTGPEKTTATVEMLNSVTVDVAGGTADGHWSFVAPLSKPRQRHAAAFIGGKIVVVGGENECEVECFTLPTAYNIAGEWTRIYPLPKALDILALLPIDTCLINICTFASISLIIKCCRNGGKAPGQDFSTYCDIRHFVRNFVAMVAR